MNKTTQPNPVPLVELKARLIKLNTNSNSPFKIREDGEYMTASLNLVDKKWVEHFEKVGITKQFELLLGFDENNHSVEYREETGNIEWNNDKPAITRVENSSKGNSQVFKKTITYGLGEANQQTLTFDSSKIAKPVFDIIKQSGWKVGEPTELEFPTLNFNIKSFIPAIVVVFVITVVIFIAQIFLFLYITQ